MEEAEMETTPETATTPTIRPTLTTTPTPTTTPMTDHPETGEEAEEEVVEDGFYDKHSHHISIPWLVVSLNAA